MGSGSSKDSSAATARRCRRGASLLFTCSSSSCFRIAEDQKVEENERSKDTACSNGSENESLGTNKKCCDKIKVAHHRKIPSLPSSDEDPSDVDHDGNLQCDSGASSSSIATAAIGSSRNNSARMRSRFNFIPDGISFRLNRAVSLGSSQAHSVFSNSLDSQNIDTRDAVIADLNSSVDNSNNNHCSTETNPAPDVSRVNDRFEATISDYYNRTSSEPNTARMRHTQRRFGHQEQFEGSVRFSRTLSVGRLRERVLRRSSLSDGFYPPAFSEDRSGTNDGQGSERRLQNGGRRAASSGSRGNTLLSDPTTVPQPRFGSSINFNDDPGSSRDLLEHRSAFLERRRRIRSQVRALQRLGSRFESLSGHDRSCILSGQHRTGSCTCRTSNRTSHPDDDTTTRASISRIVMLAEALFEVLDEIHQQSVVLTSRTSFSSIGSVPAPKEVVESIPIKKYSRPSKTLEEAAQCYICLVEYEDGDCMRVLPCNHEFHRTCVDKWLKEIHRVCPLCRGDVCLTEVSNKERVS